MATLANQKKIKLCNLWKNGKREAERIRKVATGELKI